MANALSGKVVIAGIGHTAFGKHPGRSTVSLNVEAIRKALADHLTVMVNGQVIASGAPADIRADAKVQAAYLGEEH